MNLFFYFASILALVFLLAPESPWVLIVGTAAFLATLLLIMGYTRYIERGIRYRRQLKTRIVTYCFTETNLSISDELVTTQVSWAAICQTWKRRDLWLLRSKTGHLLLLPVSAMDETLRSFVEDRLEWTHPRPVRCEKCGYDLRGQATPRCPECGTEFDARLLRFRDMVGAEPAALPRSRWPELETVLVLLLPFLVLYAIAAWFLVVNLAPSLRWAKTSGRPPALSWAVWLALEWRDSHALSMATYALLISLALVVVGFARYQPRAACPWLGLTALLGFLHLGIGLLALSILVAHSPIVFSPGAPNSTTAIYSWERSDFFWRMIAYLPFLGLAMLFWAMRSKMNRASSWSSG